MSQDNTTMKAWRLHQFGANNLKQDTIQRPVPKPHEILIKVGAVSLNYRDNAIVEGFYAPNYQPNHLIPVSDAAGTIVAVGSGVSKYRIGDRVVSHLYSHWLDGEPGPNEHAFCLGYPHPGGLAEYMILEADSVLPVPDSITDEEASTLPIAALTAWYALVNYGQLKAGETVLIQGTGGVSIFGLQIAHALGARVIVTTSSDEKGKRAKALGADEIINYQTSPDWVSEVLKLTEGKGVDQLLEVVGGNGINDSIEATRVAGKISLIGFLTGQTSNINLMRVLVRQTSLQGIAVGSLSAFAEMINAFDKYQIKPVIEKVYNFDQAVEAFDHLAKGAFGKIVIKIS